jgi:ABC-2 type transport system ATP-binding protein
MALLTIENLVGGYTRNPVLKDVSFEVKEKERSWKKYHH